jgi:hypothetical protein
VLHLVPLLAQPACHVGRSVGIVFDQQYLH